MASAEFASPAVSDALVILGAAGLVIPVFTRFRVTPIIGFILIGVAVGPFGLGRLVFEHPWLNHITISDPEALEPSPNSGLSCCSSRSVWNSASTACGKCANWSSG